MSYPVLRVHLDVMESNINKIVSKCSEHGISVWAVTKGLSAPRAGQTAFRHQDICIGRQQDKEYQKDEGGWHKSSFALIRIPMRSEVEEVIGLADYSLVSDMGTLELMSKVCESKKKEHSAMLMTDMGDLREGFWPDEAETVAEGLKKLSPALKICGIGVNYGCASGVLPQKKVCKDFCPSVKKSNP